VIVGAAGAHVLARKLENGELPNVALLRSEQGLKRMANSAPASRQGHGRPAGGALARGPGVDATATAAIATADAGAIALSPCGQPSQRVFVVRSIGVDGVTTTTLAHQSAPGRPPCGESAK